MSGNTQLGQHPDAESLNAFAEQALAVQERERIMVHLAGCGRCREIVFLAQQANAEMRPAVAAAATRTVGRVPWYRNWRLAWVPVGALAAGITVAYLVHVRHAKTAVEMAQIQDEVHPVSPSSVVPAQPPPAAKSGQSNESEAKKVTPAAREPRTAVVRQEAEGTALPANQPVNALAGLKTGPEVPVLSGQRASQEMIGAIQTVPQDKTGLENAKKVERRQFHVTAAAAPVPAKRSVAAANRVGGELAAFAVRQMELPSGLAAVSTATAEHKLLAADKAGTVFLSTDAGATWITVERQWTGKAVEVRTQMEVESKADAAVDRGLMESVFELVNDQGQVWMSLDGRIWKPR